MITRRKAALLALQAGPNLENATAAKVKEEKSEGAETPGGQELVKRMQVISLSSEKDDDDGTEEDSESEYSDEKEASAISLSSDLSATDESSDEECNMEKDDMSEVVPAKRESIPVCIDSLIAEKVLQIIKEGGDLKKLTLDYCRSYLRHHGLRISGTKPVLIDRIKQHIELKQGVPEKYKAASFTINCTGDVCKGDVIKFRQKVYKKFSVAKRGADAVGDRTVVGRVVKESYGDKKQQHTFTVEILWSSGYKPLPPMRQLLVKGRNLYRLRTYRQKWEDERLRKISLDEKHERGAAARSKRRETLRASGPRKITVGGRKQLPNPYVATGPSVYFPPNLIGGRGSVGPRHRSWFPSSSSVHGQTYVFPQKPVVPQHSGFYALRENANDHSNQSGGVAHGTRVQPPIPEPKGASDHHPAPGTTENENKELNDMSKPSFQSQSLPCNRLASTASKEGASLHNISTAGVPADTGPRVQPPSEGSRTSGADPAHNGGQTKSKSPCRSDMNRWRNDANNRNIPGAGVQHDLRPSLLGLPSRTFSGANPYVDMRQIENRSPRRSDMNRWRVDTNSIPANGMSQDVRASPLRPPNRTVPWTDPFIDRRQNENKSPWRNDHELWKADTSLYKVAGVSHDIRSLSTGTESRNFLREDPVMTHNGNLSPWRFDSNGWRRDHHTDHHARHNTQAQQARTQHSFSGNHSPDRRQTENRSQRRYDLSPRDVGQQNHVPTGGQFPSFGSLFTDEHFKCPRVGCANQGSKLCTYKICLRCCTQQGLNCSNPKHARASHS